jgi:hypothetical protein
MQPWRAIQHHNSLEQSSGKSEAHLLSYIPWVGHSFDRHFNRDLRRASLYPFRQWSQVNAASAAVLQRAPAQQRLGREIRAKGDDAFLFCASFFRLEAFSIASTGCVDYRLHFTAI